ncbi:MAG: antibiotic biosynthesis monooxygenase [Spirochaetales bacterium]|nr:antibiotic biosynthesis monooxygenase [Spirochaetales bacterium]
MIVYCVEVQVVPGKEEEFKAASLRNHQATRKEPGNIRFDVLQQTEDSSRFFLYEAYTSEDAVKAHKETAHYLEWRETVAPWMAAPRKGTSHSVCAPEEPEKW